jgi:hypothetical protein
MDIQKLLDQIDTNPQCQIYPVRGLPQVDDKHTLPADIVEFYTLCGGVDLFTESDYSYKIVPSNDFIRANPVIMGNFWQEWEDDISANWYIVASNPERQYLTIDLNLQKLGRCYDSFIGHHANPRYCPIIATSFTDLFHRLLQNSGQYPYWLEPNFRSLGDAYDN